MDPTARDRPADSAMARGFGAEIAIGEPDGRALFLVVGRGGSPEAAIRGLGGHVLVRLPGGIRVLAVLPVLAQGPLGRHPAVALAGPVTIDPDRFARFAALSRLDADPGG